MTVYDKIKAAIESMDMLPQRVVLPQAMFDEFARDVAATGHAQTVWGVPVVAGNVLEMQFDHGVFDHEVFESRDRL